MSLICADARALPITAGVVHCCVTSPPYYGLRDYGGPGQIGLEATPAGYIAALVAVFREVWRVLRDDGTCWVNLGDSYAPNWSSVRPAGGGGFKTDQSRQRWTRLELAPKQLMMIPARAALALQADGWYLRSDIIWAKPNPMPESVTDRPTKSHEHLFLLAKSERYYYAAAAIAEAAVDPESFNGRRARNDDSFTKADRDGFAKTRAGLTAIQRTGRVYATRNRRDVWTIPAQPYYGAHFATMPEALVAPCILAGCPPGGLVLDPFIGSGTVGAVAARLGRRWVGTDLNYQPLAAARTAQRGLIFSEAAV